MPRAETSSPAVVDRPDEKKNLSGSTPRGVCTNFSFVTRLTVRLVHVDHLGHLAQRERLEVLHALLEELALPVDDVVHDLEHRLPALLDRLDHPVGGVQLVGDELLVLAVELLLVARDLLVGACSA